MMSKSLGGTVSQTMTLSVSKRDWEPLKKSVKYLSSMGHYH